MYSVACGLSPRTLRRVLEFVDAKQVYFPPRVEKWASDFGTSAAYLTVSEIFPMEIRAMAIAFFFVVAQGAGILAPWLYGKLIETSAESVFYGYLLGAGMMLVGAIVELWLGVKAERRSLEHIATPLSAQPFSEDAPRA